MKLLLTFLLLATFLIGQNEPSVTSLHHINYAPQHYRFVKDGMKSEDGNSYATLEPYIAFGLGVIQFEGPKHKDKDLVTCVPEAVKDERGLHLELKCDDGSRFGVTAVSFPAKGQ